MAITDGMVASVLAIGLLYFFMFNHRVRWVRLVGSVLIIVTAGVFGVVEDTAVMYVLFLINLVIGGLKLVSITSVLTGLSKKNKEWF